MSLASVGELRLPMQRIRFEVAEDLPTEAGPRARKAAGSHEIQRFEQVEGLLVVVLEAPSPANQVDPASDSLGVDVYADPGHGSEPPRALLAAVNELAFAVGLAQKGRPEVRSGSWWQRTKAWFRRELSSEEVQTRLQKAERALELAALGQRQADVDVKLAEATAMIMREMREQNRAVVKVGSLLAVKYHDGVGDVVVIKQLSEVELRAMDHFAGLTARPEKTLELLTLAVAELNAPAGERPAWPFWLRRRPRHGRELPGQ